MRAGGGAGCRLIGCGLFCERGFDGLQLTARAGGSPASAGALRNAHSASAEAVDLLVAVNARDSAQHSDYTDSDHHIRHDHREASGSRWVLFVSASRARARAGPPARRRVRRAVRVGERLVSATALRRDPSSASAVAASHSPSALAPRLYPALLTSATASSKCRCKWLRRGNRRATSRSTPRRQRCQSQNRSRPKSNASGASSRSVMPTAQPPTL
jgi:hypothetical protein